MPSIINATTTTGLVSSADNSGSLQLATNNGTTAVTINTSQSVGIGTTTPSGKLHTFQSGADSTVQFEAGTAGYASNLNLIANTAPGGAYNNITSFSGGSAEWRIGGSGNNNTIVFSTGSGYTERMRIDSSGRITMSSQPSFRAYATSAQSPGPGAVIVFNNDSATGMFNTGGHYNTSNGRFTAPVTGVYALTASVLYQSCPNGQYGDTSIYRNGGTMINYNRRQYQSTYTGYGGYFEAQISVVVKLTAGDYVTINNGSASTQSLYVNDASWTWFSGWLLG